MSETVKESKAQRAERLKRELNPWEAFDEIRRFAREGHASIPPEWWCAPAGARGGTSRRPSAARK